MGASSPMRPFLIAVEGQINVLLLSLDRLTYRIVPERPKMLRHARMAAMRKLERGKGRNDQCPVWAGSAI
ncbi:MAG: hypothetical protein ACJASZ_002888 [Yoonia sp.]|jgi:hypothetical protein